MTAFCGQCKFWLKAARHKEGYGCCTFTPPPIIDYDEFKIIDTHKADGCSMGELA